MYMYVCDFLFLETTLISCLIYIYIFHFIIATGRDKEKERLLANEKVNFKLLAQKVR